MDAMTLTLTPTGWRGTALGPWLAELGAYGGESPLLAEPTTPVGDVVATLARLLPPHVVITVEVTQ